MLLNKINVLDDKGFVALVDTNCNGKHLQEIQDEYFRTKINSKLLDIASATLVIKAPIFVQLNMSRYRLDVVSTPLDDVEAFTPDLSQIDAEDTNEKEEIREYIDRTTEALLLNGEGMTMDGADEFTSQILTPISVYNELIVSGSLREWIRFIKQNGLPMPIEKFRSSVEDALRSEWKNIDKLKSMVSR